MGPPSSDHRKSPYGLVQVDNSESPPNDKSPTSHRRNRPENPFPRLATYRNRKYASFYVGNRPLLLPGPSVAPAATPSKRRGKKIEFPLSGSVFRLSRPTDRSDRHRTSAILCVFSRPTFSVLIDFPVRPLLSRQIGHFSEKSRKKKIKKIDSPRKTRRTEKLYFSLTFSAPTDES